MSKQGFTDNVLQSSPVEMDLSAVWKWNNLEAPVAFAETTKLDSGNHMSPQFWDKRCDWRRFNIHSFKDLFWRVGVLNY